MGTSEYGVDTLRQDGALIQRRRWPSNAPSVLEVVPATDRSAPGTFRRLEHEYALRADLDSAWAVRPLELSRREGRPVLVSRTRAASLWTSSWAPLELGLCTAWASPSTRC
jgi:hypothetical protein